MLRGLGRVHSQQHLSLTGQRHARLIRYLHPSCAPSTLQALTTDLTRHVPQGTPLPPVYQGAPLAYPETMSSFLAVSHSPRPCGTPEHPGQFPSGIIHTIDAFSSATKQETASIVSVINVSPNSRRYIRQRESARRLAQFFASTSRPSRAHSVMVLAHTLGCRFKPNHFESVVHQLSLKERWSLIPPLVSLAIEQCGKTTARLLNWKLRAFIECHRFAQLDHVFKEFAWHNVQPTQRTFHLLISGHLRNQDLRSAKRSLQSMETAGFPVNASTHALIVTAYRSLGWDPQVHARALEALRHVDVRTSTRILNSVIQHILDVGDESSAAEHINRMIAPLTPERETLHRPGDITTGVDGVVSSLIDTCSPSSGRTPAFRADAATFTILINYLNRRRQFHRIHKLLDRMVEMGIRPDSGVVAALIRTYSLSGRDDLAMGMLAAMLESDTDSQSVLALVCLKSIPQLPINVAGIDLTVHVFNAVLPRVMEIRGLGGARSIIRIMRCNGIQLNATTLEVFLDYLDRTERIKTCRLTQVLRSMSRKVHGPTVRHLNIILRSALRREKHRAHGSGWDATAAKFSSTRRRPFTFPEDRSILDSANFDPSGSHRLPRDGTCIRSAVRALSRRGIKSDRATYALWLRHEGIADPTVGTAKSVFHHMIDKGIHASRHHYTSLMEGFMRAGDVQAAEQVMRSAKAAGFEPDVVMWTVLISGHARNGNPELAMRTFRIMVAAGVPPDVPAIDALTHAYFAVGAYSVARRVLLELWPQVKPLPSELKSAPLKQLARIFRQPEKPAVAGVETLSPQEQRSFSRKLRQVLREWSQA